MNFRQLHQQEKPLILCNVWDVTSAQIAEELAFDAIGTSSAAIASMLGYNDGEDISFDELIYMIKRILEVSSLPLSVDIESGYNAEKSTILDRVNLLVEMGVVGINLEDRHVQDQRTLLDAERFAETVATIKEHLVDSGIDLFLNVRTDTFLLGVESKMEETQRRVRLFEAAGADGIFVPCVESKADIADLISITTKPLNVMCMPNLPQFNVLHELGVKRISMGNFLFEGLKKHLMHDLSSIVNTQSFHPIFATC